MALGELRPRVNIHQMWVVHHRQLTLIADLLLPIAQHICNASPLQCFAEVTTHASLPYELRIVVQVTLVCDFFHNVLLDSLVKLAVS